MQCLHQEELVERQTKFGHIQLSANQNQCMECAMCLTLYIELILIGKFEKF